MAVKGAGPTVKEFAKTLGVSCSKVYRWLNDPAYAGVAKWQVTSDTRHRLNPEWVDVFTPPTYGPRLL